MGIYSCGGGIAVLESNIITGTLGVYLSGKIPILRRLISLLQSPGIPWSLDVSLLALLYLALGFFYKSQIKNMMQFKTKRYDIVAIVVIVGLSISCYSNFRTGESAYYFDMKPVHYHELFIGEYLPDGTANRRGGLKTAAGWFSLTVQLVLWDRYIHA